MTSPTLSVIVPTRDRADSVLRLLHALASQMPIAEGCEVIVAADGCTDGTESRVRAIPWSFDVHVLQLPPSGAATARNCAAVLAQGEVLLFLDDDVEPAAGMLRAHLNLHESGVRLVGLGYLPPVPAASGLFASVLRGWWESMFDGPRRPAHRYSFRNLLTGHFSIRRADFESLRGFDPGLLCHEDWEFGHRAIASGLQLAFVPAAVAWHRDDTDLAKALRRKFEEGIADVQLARAHPELRRALPLGWTTPVEAQQSWIVHLAWRHPRAGDRLFGALLHLLPFYEHWRLRFRWRALLENALTYWYWRGVAHLLGTPEALGQLGSPPTEPGTPEVVVDLADGVNDACSRVDALRPRSLLVLYHGRVVGSIPNEPGCEPLRGVHLRGALAETLASGFARALAAEHDLPEALTASLQAQATSSDNRAAAPKAFAA